PAPGQKFTTPSGMPHSSSNSTNFAAIVGESLDGFRMTVLRSEEHTSELQSPCNIVCRLLLEKKINKIDIGDGAFATFLFPKIELQIFRFRKHLKPLLKRFHVDHAHLRALFEQIGDKMTANEA